MPRTVESIVDCHQVAMERQAAGRPVWDKKLMLFQPAPEGTEYNSIAIAALNIYATNLGEIIKAGLPTDYFDFNSDNYDEDIENLVDSLECFVSDGHKMPHQRLTEIIDGIYDWADQKRVWIEFKYPEPIIAPAPAR